MPRSRTEQLIVSIIIGLLTATIVLLTVANPGGDPPASASANAASRRLNCRLDYVGNDAAIEACEAKINDELAAIYEQTWMQENQALTGLVAGLAAFGLALGVFAFISPQPRT